MLLFNKFSCFSPTQCFRYLEKFSIIQEVTSIFCLFVSSCYQWQNHFTLKVTEIILVKFYSKTHSLYLIHIPLVIQGLAFARNVFLEMFVYSPCWCTPHSSVERYYLFSWHTHTFNAHRIQRHFSLNVTASHFRQKNLKIVHILGKKIFFKPVSMFF